MSFKRMIARFVLGLPEKWIYKLAGGAPLTIGGRTLDARMQWVAHVARRAPPVTGLSVGEIRKRTEDGMSLIPQTAEPGVTWRDDEIALPDRRLPVRIYMPEDQDSKASVLVYFHSGGGVVGTLHACHAFCSMIAATARRPVLSVGYRLAPEHKWPAGVRDAIAAYEWALGRAETLGAPAGRAAIGGDSMGGNFAAIVTQEMKRQGAPMPDLQLLIYPMLDMTSQTPSMKLYQGVFPMTQDMMEFFVRAYLPIDANIEDSWLSPGLSTDLSDLSPAIIVGAGFDPLVDQGRQYHERLKEAGSRSTYVCHDSLSHGFVSFTSLSPAADAACRAIAKMLVRPVGKALAKAE